MQRNPYKTLHKTIRARLSEVDSRAGSIDFADQEARVAYQEDFTRLASLLEHHGQHEDAHIHPLLAEYGESEVRAMDDQHEALEREFKELDKALELTLAATGVDRWTAAHDFYLQFERFAANYLLHLHDEETIALPLLLRCASEEELDELARADYAGEVPEQLQPMLARMLPSWNIADIALTLWEIERVVPNDTNQRYREVFRAELPADYWQSVEELSAHSR